MLRALRAFSSIRVVIFLCSVDTCIVQRLTAPLTRRLISINAVSLALALIANLALLLNMGRRLSFAVAQSITIVGWLLSASLLIALVSVASSDSFRSQLAERHALTQAYYYAVMAAALYCLVSVLMVVNVAGAVKHHYEKEFRLTISQRTLMLQTISFMAYLLLGALVFSKIEGWSYSDAVYWADFTMLTVGIGADFVPKTHLGRSLLFPFAIGGIVTVGLVIGSVRSLVLERGKVKMEARMTEKKREKVLATIDRENRTIKVGLFKKRSFSQKGLTELQRREQEFNVMREIQARASKRRRWTALASSTVAAMALWLVGAAIFEKAEHDQGWSYFVALYFSYTSLLTIGYGDLQPMSNSGKPFFVFWSLLAVPTLTILISNMGDTVVKAFSDFTIWAGSLTILPGEGGARTSIKASAAKLSRGRLFHSEELKVKQPPGLLPNGGGDGSKSNQSKLDDIAMDRVASHIEDDELGAAESAGERGDFLERDIHFYHYVLVKELRKIMKDVEASPPKQYSYDEWAYYLKLIGEDENDADNHRAPPVTPDRRGEGQGPGLGTAGRSKAGREDAAAGATQQWSWLGVRSPLMGSKAEAEWIMERLSATLENELRKMRSGGSEEHKQPPPISMADLRRRSPSDSEEDGSTAG